MSSLAMVEIAVDVEILPVLLDAIEVHVDLLPAAPTLFGGVSVLLRFLLGGGVVARVRQVRVP